MTLGHHPGFDQAEYIRPLAIHPSARVDEFARVTDSEIGARSVVWQFASVVRSARIGQDCSIASCAIVDGARLGDRVRVSHSAFIDPGIVICNDVFIGPNVSLCNDAWPRTDKIGFDVGAFVSGEFVTTRIEEGASLGAGVIVLPGLTIGRGAMVSAGAVVTKSVPDCHLVKRGGEMVPIDPSRVVQRMRRA